MNQFFFIVTGAAMGALCRYGLDFWITSKLGTSFTYSTWIINFIGSFVLGLFLALHLDRGLFSPNVRYFMAVGWCASFTTYSTFSWETFRYIEDGSLGMAGFNVGLMVISCLFATWAGVALAKLL